MKILIIANNALSSTQNNGKTVRSLLAKIPKNNLAQFYFGTNESPDVESCENYYRVTEIDQLKAIARFSFKTTNTHANLLSSSGCVMNESVLIKKLKKINKTLAPFRDIIWRMDTWDTEELDLWIRKFNPDLIFAVLGGGIFGHRIVQVVSDQYQIPYVAYFTDDYYINDCSTNIIQKLYYKQLRRTYRETIKKAALCYTIGSLMSAEYSQEFHRKFGELVNAVDFTKFSKLLVCHMDLKNDIIISFIGGIHLGRWKSISELGRLIQEINREYATRIRIEVFTTTRPDPTVLDVFSQNKIYYGGALSADEVLSQIEKSHLMLHVESFDAKYRIYTKYSISTKIPEYLASKRGIIAYGPSEIASMKIFKTNGWGCCLSDDDTDVMMKQKILDYIKSFEPMNAMNAYNYAYKTFNQDIISENLIQDFTQIIK